MLHIFVCVIKLKIIHNYSFLFIDSRNIALILSKQNKQTKSWLREECLYWKVFLDEFCPFYCIYRPNLYCCEMHYRLPQILWFMKYDTQLEISIYIFYRQNFVCWELKWSFICIWMTVSNNKHSKYLIKSMISQRDMNKRSGNQEKSKSKYK